MFPDDPDAGITSGLKLNIGCGTDLRPFPWVNTDVSEPPKEAVTLLTEPGNGIFPRSDLETIAYRYHKTDDAPVYVKTDITKRWPFANSTFETVFAGCVLPHIPPPCNGEPDGLDYAIKEAYRVLKPYGRLIVTCPSDKVGYLGVSGPNHYRLINRQTFAKYTTLHDVSRSLEDSTGVRFYPPTTIQGVHPPTLPQKDERGRPMGSSKIAPDFLPLGYHGLGILTHLFRRLRLIPLLEGREQIITLVKPLPIEYYMGGSE